MRRWHNLLHRNHHQSWLARKILARHPLVTRMARIQLLPQVLGLNQGSAAVPGQASFFLHPDFDWEQRPASLLPGLVFRVPLTEMTDYEPERTSVSHPAGEVQSQEMLKGVDIGDAEDEVTNVIDPVEEVLDPQIVESVQANDFESELPAPERKEAVPSSESNEAERVEIQPERVPTEGEGPSQLVKVKPTRGHIQESPTVDRRDQPLPPSSSSRTFRSNREQAKAHSRVDAPIGELETKAREESSADELFAPRGTDRSPQAWMARLMGTGDAAPSSTAFSPLVSETERRSVQGPGISNAPTKRVQLSPRSGNENAIQPSGRVMLPTQKQEIHAESHQLVAAKADDAVRSATPVTERARRFLQPLVGIDPASVRVYQDAVAERLTDAYQADALTKENEVEIAASHPHDTPETLSLLAHELTHVARLREPRFIPPIARSVNTTPSGQAHSMDEEALALKVERRVERAARLRIGQEVPFPSELAGEIGEPAASLTNLPIVSRAEDDTWGGLPAPWEPLPDWLVASTATTESNTTMPVMSSQPSHITHRTGGIESTISQADGSANGRTGGLPGSVQRAGRERSESTAEEQEAQMVSSAPSSAGSSLKAPEPDLDALAHQVYTYLKRRLNVERRRGH